RRYNGREPDGQRQHPFFRHRNISDDCQPLVTVAFHCGGTTTRPAPVDCVVSPFSAWSECVNGWQTRTRTILVRPRNGGRPCPHLTERQPCTDIAVDLCI